MTNQSQAAPAGFNASRFFPLLLILFAGSGFSALIYEIVWYQLLQLAVGSTAVSLGVLLATFMGGLCLGSLLLPRLRLGGRHPLRIYAALELGIGLCGILVLFGMPFMNRAYIAGAALGMPGMLLRGLIAAICMLPPTILMGASLPAIVRWVDSTPRGVSWWGFLYGGNTLGAVLGCVFAGFYLLRLYDMAVATYFAVAVNLVVALMSFWLAGRTPAHAASDETTATSAPGDIASAADHRIGKQLDRLRHDCLVRRNSFGRRGRLDASGRHDPRFNGLRFFDHPRGFSYWPCDRERHRFMGDAKNAGPAGPGMVPDSSGARHRMDCLHDFRFSSLLAVASYDGTVGDIPP